MRGGAQAHLIEADDDRSYVVKFTNNPQGGKRILINEVIYSLLCQEFGIDTPEVAYVVLDENFLRCNPDVFMTEGRKEFAVETGLHFGSQCPGLPGLTSIYDFFPDELLPELHNRYDFLGALVLDKWLSNQDARQSIFFRARVLLPSGEKDARWIVQMIDHGNTLQGTDWVLRDSPLQGLCGRLAVYGNVDIQHFDPWLDRLADLKFSALEEIFDVLPSEWIGTDGPELRRLLSTLYTRRQMTRSLVAESLQWIHARQSRKRDSLVSSVESYRSLLETTERSCAIGG
jgi:hypothetical protein